MPTRMLPPLAVAKSVPRNADVLVVGMSETGVQEVPEAIARAFAKRFGVTVSEMAASLGAKANADSKRTLPAAGGGPRVVVVGLGSEQSNEDLRRAAGAGVRHAASVAENGSVSVAVSLGSGTIGAITVIHSTDVKGADIAAKIVAQAVVTVREWVNTPANLLYPESFAEQVRKLVIGSNITIDVLDETALSEGGYGGLMAVGGGSSRPPRLVRLSYSPKGAKFHLALVGKGITFDSGGLNLKPAEGMYAMKYDMAGAATVLGAVHAIAQLGLKIKVTAYGALAENMPSGSAFRPSDVLTIYGGKTVENGNSDAEGRLVMADALARDADGRLRGRPRPPDGWSDGHRRRDRRPGTGCCRDGWRGHLAASDSRGDPRHAGLQGRRPPLYRARPLGRRSGGRRLPSGVRSRRHPMGTSRHCRTRIPGRKAVRVCRSWRDRGRRTHAHRPRPFARGTGLTTHKGIWRLRTANSG